jgi:hypothetical protein
MKKTNSKMMPKKMVSEYGGMEKYASKKAKAMHEKKEPKSMEKKEKMMAKASMKKKK